MPLTATVSASSANLGPGFDALGMAVDLTCTVHATPSPIDVATYHGVGGLTLDADNLVHQGFRRALEAAGHPATTVALEIHNDIPLARGLGSSSAALVAGVLLGDAVSGGTLGREGVLQLAADLEGHPDNVAPAVYGGVTLSAASVDAGWVTTQLPWPEDWRIAFGVPAHEVSTRDARAVLAPHVTRADAILTASRLAFWPVALLTEDPTYLTVASRDVLHEPQRHPLLPGFAEAQRDLLEAGAWAAFLSGAGPTLGVVCSEGLLPTVRSILTGYAGAEGSVLMSSIGGAATVQGTWG